MLVLMLAGNERPGVEALRPTRPSGGPDQEGEPSDPSLGLGWSLLAVAF